VKSLKESISTKVMSVNATDPVSRAYHMMKQGGCRHLPVLDDGRLVGLISDRDVQRALKSDVHDIFSMPVVEISLDAHALVKSYMSSPVITAKSGEDLLTATKIMLDNKIGALVIVDDNHLTGILTRHDLMKVLADLLEHPQHTIMDRLEGLAYNSGIGEVVKALSNSGI